MDDEDIPPTGFVEVPENVVQEYEQCILTALVQSSLPETSTCSELINHNRDATNAVLHVPGDEYTELESVVHLHNHTILNSQAEACVRSLTYRMSQSRLSTLNQYHRCSSV